MEITEKDFRKVVLILLLVALAVLAFVILRPIMLSIIGGLILAYMFSPLYRIVLTKLKNPTLSASLVSILLLLIIVVPLWFLLPKMSVQVFELFKLTQGLDIQKFVTAILPGASDQFVSQIVLTANTALGKLSSSVLNYLVNLLVDFPTISLHLLLVAFVFFFALRDESELRQFVSGLSPLNKTQEKVLVKQFKDVTDSVVYGQVLVGIFQGIVAGIGLFLFGVPNALFLTFFAIIMGIMPVIGPPLVYIPVTLYLYSTNSFLIATAYLVYNLIFVSTLEHVIRANIVSRRTNLSQVFILIGMVGGLFMFGILGLILGPLIIAYFITLLKAYKENTLSSLFASN